MYTEEGVEGEKESRKDRIMEKRVKKMKNILKKDSEKKQNIIIKGMRETWEIMEAIKKIEKEIGME